MLGSCQFLDAHGNEIHKSNNFLSCIIFLSLGIRSFQTNEFHIGVPAPCFTVPKCPTCKEPGSLKNVPGNDSVIVITLDGIQYKPSKKIRFITK